LLPDTTRSNALGVKRTLYGAKVSLKAARWAASLSTRVPSKSKRRARGTVKEGLQSFTAAISELWAILRAMNQPKSTSPGTRI
jgi:hypothetical protein